MGRMSGEHDAPPPPPGRSKAPAPAAEPRGRSAPQVVIAVILLIAALLATASGILRLVWAYHGAPCKPGGGVGRMDSRPCGASLPPPPPLGTPPLRGGATGERPPPS